MQKIDVQNALKELPPVCFALPMSTGIVAVASYILGYFWLSEIFFVINNIELIVLVFLLIWRLLFYFNSFKKDLASREKGAGFLAIVAALCILGTKNVLVKNDLSLALWGWSFTFVIWLFLLYSFFISIATKDRTLSFPNSLNGSWLLFIVSAQALSISGNLVSIHFDFAPKLTQLITLLLFLLGALFYIIIISLIFYRMAFLPMYPKDFKPSYWINMGAAAISALSGAVLINTINATGAFQQLIPTLKTMSIFFWIAGSWWIPILVYLEIWKRRKIKTFYRAENWSIVFPLGVYTVCTWQLAEVMEIDFLKRLPEVSIYFAWAAWLFTYLTLIFWFKKTYFIKKK